MPNVSGVVKWVGSKAVRNSTLWSFSVEGNTEFFRCGFTKPNINKGDNVTFEYEVNQYGNQVNAKDIRVLGSAPPQAARTAPTQQVSGGSKDDYWKKKEENDVVKDASIQYMACTNTAVSILKLAQDAGVLTLGAGAKANKLDTLLQQVYLIRDELYGQVMEARDKAAKGEDIVEKQLSQTLADDEWLTEMEAA
jgi:hypothetical protein